jgi:hypothetical protein
MARTKATTLRRKQGSGAAGRQAKKPRTSVAVPRGNVGSDGKPRKKRKIFGGPLGLKWTAFVDCQPAKEQAPGAKEQAPVAKQAAVAPVAKQAAVATAKQAAVAPVAKQAAVATAKQAAVAPAVAKVRNWRSDHAQTSGLNAPTTGR